MDTPIVKIILEFQGIFQSLLIILGFIITIWQVKKTIMFESAKQKQQIYLEKIADTPFRLITIIDEACEETNNKYFLKEFSKTMNTLLAYGSLNIIRLVTRTKQSNNPLEEILAITILIIVQLKFEITGTVTSPECYYLIKAGDYKDNPEVRQLHIQKNNQIVIEEELNKGFLIMN